MRHARPPGPGHIGIFPECQGKGCLKSSVEDTGLGIDLNRKYYLTVKMPSSELLRWSYLSVWLQDNIATSFARKSTWFPLHWPGWSYIGTDGPRKKSPVILVLNHRKINTNPRSHEADIQLESMRPSTNIQLDIKISFKLNSAFQGPLPVTI